MRCRGLIGLDRRAAERVVAVVGRARPDRLHLELQADAGELHVERMRKLGALGHLEAQPAVRDVDDRRRRLPMPDYMNPSTVSSKFKVPLSHRSPRFGRHVARTVEFVQP